MPRKVKPNVIENIGGRKVEVLEGDEYFFVANMETRSGLTHPKGSILRVLSRTTETPHGEISQSGYNWECMTRFGVSIWATLEQCISRNMLILKGREK